MVFGLGRKKKVIESVEAMRAQAKGHQGMQALVNIMNQPDSAPLAILSLDDESVRTFVMNDPVLAPLTPLISRAISTTYIDARDIGIIIAEYKALIQEYKWSLRRSEITDNDLAKMNFLELYITTKLRDSVVGWKFDKLTTRRAEIRMPEGEEKERR